MRTLAFGALVAFGFLACGGGSPARRAPRAPEKPRVPEMCGTPEVDLSTMALWSGEASHLDLRFRCQDAPKLACKGYDDCKENVDTKIRYRYVVGEDSWEGEWAASAMEPLGTVSRMTTCHSPFDPWGVSDTLDEDGGAFRRLSCTFGGFGFETHLVADQRAHGLVDKPVGRLTLLEVALTFPNGSSVKLDEVTFPKIATSFVQNTALTLKPYSKFAAACKGQRPEHALSLIHISEPTRPY